MFMLFKYFFPSQWLLYIFLTVALRKKFLILIKCYMSIFPFMDVAFGVASKNITKLNIT